MEFFYLQTYDQIVSMFGMPTLSAQHKLLVAWSWMSGHFKPIHLERLEALMGREPTKFEELTQENCAESMVMYVEAEQVLGTVGATKFLHFAYPDAFMMWDNKVRRYVSSLPKLASHNQGKLYEAFCLTLAQKYRTHQYVGVRPVVLPSVPRMLDIWLWDLSR